MNIICINFVGIERDRQTLQGVYMYNYVCILYSTEPEGVYMYTYNYIVLYNAIVFQHLNRNILQPRFPRVFRNIPDFYFTLPKQPLYRYM